MDMVCIYCAQATRVSNSRLQRRANTIWRRRTCLSCGAIFTTHEQAALGSSLLVSHKKNPLLAPFERDRLFISIYRSCQHRSTALEDASALVKTVISQLPPPINGTIEVDIIAATTYKILQRFDSIAAALYRAYHPIS